MIYEEIRGQGGGFKEVNRCVWKDGLFDVTWSEANEAILVAASGDGKLLIVDQSAIGRPGPAAVLSGHTAEVCSTCVKPASSNASEFRFGQTLVSIA